MDFDQKSPEGREYARVYPTMSGENGNRALREAASEAGNKDMVAFVRAEGKDSEWRLYKDQIPGGLDVDKAFGRFATEEQKAASIAESDKFKERTALASNVTKAPRGQDIPVEDRMYPNTSLRAEFDREVAARKKQGVEVKYDSGVSAYHVVAGSKEGFDKYKTPEAKAQWDSEAELSTQERKKMAAEADRAIDVTKERAAGRHFVADNATGFKLLDVKPSRFNSADQIKQNEKVNKAQMQSMAKASDVDISRVLARTREAHAELQDTQMQIRLNKALDLHAHKGLTRAEFYAAGRKQEGDRGLYEGENRQRELAGGAGLGPTEFGHMVALQRGLTAIRKEAQDRNLIGPSRNRGQSNEQQQEQGQQEQGQQEAKRGPQQEQGQQRGEQQERQSAGRETAGADAPTEQTTQGRRRGGTNRQWSNAMAQGMER